MKVRSIHPSDDPDALNSAADTSTAVLDPSGLSATAFFADPAEAAPGAWSGGWPARGGVLDDHGGDVSLGEAVPADRGGVVALANSFVFDDASVPPADSADAAATMASFVFANLASSSPQSNGIGAEVAGAICDPDAPAPSGSGGVVVPSLHLETSAAPGSVGRGVTAIIPLADPGSVAAPGHDAGAFTMPTVFAPAVSLVASSHEGGQTMPDSSGSMIFGPVPAELASLPNPPAEGSHAVITSAGVGSGGATAAQIRQAIDESGLTDTGAGITVGVLSDSFNDLGGAAADEASGALPPAADINVIKDLASGGSDEGRAMMQIIHDIAPGANLAFYTAFDSEQDFANGILALAAAGCKVIVDDVSYFDEPFFQNGVVAQAIQTVESEGVTYVTAAGNETSNGYQAAWTPTSGSFHGTSLTDAESFGGSPVQTVTINTEGTSDDVPLVLEWNQAYGTVSSSTADLEILVFNSNGQLIGTATNASDGEPTNPWVEFDFTTSGTYFVAIENLHTGTNPSLIKDITEGDGLPATISGANTGTVVGHAMTPGAITAAAVSVAETPPFGVSPPISESFSSSGAGAELLFANNGTPLGSPDVLSPVVVSGVDGIQTTVPGGLSDFFGTSAASASLAGVAALILSTDPTLTPAQVEQIMEETALPMANSTVSGAGLAQVDPAIAALVAPSVAVVNVTLSTGDASVPAQSLIVSASDLSGEPITGYGFIDTGPGHFVLNGVTEPNDQEIDITAAQLSELTYQSALGTIDTLQIRAEDATGWGNRASLTVTAPPLVIQTDTSSFGSTSLTQVADEYFLNNSGGSGPVLKAGGVALVAGEVGGWVPIGAVQTASGYEVAWKLPSADEFSIWTVDSNGNETSASPVALAANSPTLESAELTFNQDLNGDGTIGPPTTVIQTDGSISLTQVGDNYFLYDNGSGPVLKAGGVALIAGEVGGWVPIGAVQTASGYEVAWKLPSADEFSIWTVDSNGNETSASPVALAANSPTLESAELTFNQDLNGDGVIGPTTTVIQTDTSSFGSTSLTQVADEYFLNNSGGSGPVLKAGGVALVAGEVGGWVPIGAVQTASGYEVAWKLPSADEFSIWTVDSNGNETSASPVALAANSPTLESAELTFNQDLNGDGTIGPPTTVIQTDGSISLTQVGDNYFLYDNGSGPVLKAGGVALIAGEVGGWVPIGAVQTASGYEVAWKLPSADEFSIWTVDSNGNETSASPVALAANSPTLESAELTFNQDLNGDGVIGPTTTVIQTDTSSFGSTSLTQVADEYFLNNSGGSGPVLKAGGVALVAGEVGGWVPIGAVQTASGYEVAWKLPSADEFSIWTVDSNGNETSASPVALAANSPTLESAELTFNQDLNGDGTIGPPGSSGTAGGGATNGFVTQSLAAGTFLFTNLVSHDAGTASGQPSVTVGGPDNDSFSFKSGFDIVANDLLGGNGSSLVPDISQREATLHEAQTSPLHLLLESAIGRYDTATNLVGHEPFAEFHASSFAVHLPIVG